MNESVTTFQSRWLTSAKGVAYVLGMAAFGAIAAVSWSRGDLRQTLLSMGIAAFLTCVSLSQARKRDLILTVGEDGMRLASFPFVGSRKIAWREVMTFDVDETAGQLHALLKDGSRLLLAQREQDKPGLVKLAEEIDGRRRKNSSKEI